jgi:hypothetical protein
LQQGDAHPHARTELKKEEEEDLKQREEALKKWNGELRI